MKRALPAVLAGSAVLFFWQFLSWAVFMWHAREYKPFTDEAAVLKVVADNAPASGAYASPGFKEGMSKAEMDGVLAAKLQGPFVYALVSKEGVKPMGPAMGLSFLGNFLAAFFAVWLVAQLGPRSFVERVGALLTAAWLAWAWAKWPDFVWWGFPGRMLAIELADYTVSWLLAGSAIAWTLHPRASE